MTLAMTDRVDARIDELALRIDFLVAEAEEVRELRQSIKELLSDLTPIASQGMGSLTELLDTAEHRGYFDFTKASLDVVDRVVGSFGSEDVEALGENIVLILETLKDMTQPQVMQMLRSTLHQAQEPVDPPSLFALARQLREPAVRRGLARLVAVLRNVGTPEDVSDIKGKEARS